MASACAFGIDLAWAAHHPSGVCAVDAAGAVVAEGWLGGDDEIVAWVAGHVGPGPAVAAIDAPLHVPNDTGRRRCESELHRVYGARAAGPHSSNRTLFRRVHGRVRGEDLAARLAGLGFGDPWSGSARTAVEVYPHPGLIEVFGLEMRLPYKAKRGRTVTDRRDGLHRLAGLVASLAEAEPPLVAPRLEIGDGLRGAGLKAAEDLLDARFCAWMAARWLTAGPAGFTLYGDAAGGHIAVPLPGSSS